MNADRRIEEIIGWHWGPKHFDPAGGYGWSRPDVGPPTEQDTIESFHARKHVRRAEVDDLAAWLDEQASDYSIEHTEMGLWFVDPFDADPREPAHATIREALIAAVRKVAA